MNTDIENKLAEKTDMAIKNGHIIKIDNSFNRNYAFNSLGAYEQNVAWAIISMFSSNESSDGKVKTKLTVNSLEIRNLAGIGSQRGHVTKAEYRRLVEKLRDFFLTQFFVVHIREGDILVERGTPVFKYFDILNDGEQISIELMPEAAHFFSRIFSGVGFSIFALQKMVNISSPTAKTLYRLFLDGSHIHGWNASHDELVSLFGFSKPTAFYSFFRRLDKFIEQVKDTGDFEILEYNPIRDSTKRGNPIISIRFDVKIKEDRIPKLLRNYHNKKGLNAKKSPKFYPLKVEKDSVSTTLVPSSNGGSPIAIANTKKKIVDIKCPNCKGSVQAYVTTDDKKVILTCSNSKYWGIGSGKCNFFIDENCQYKLNDDMKLWIEQMQKSTEPKDKTLNLDETLATCIRKLENDDNSEYCENSDSGTTYDPDNPFPL